MSERPDFVRRTYEPFKFLGRLFFVPLTTLPSIPVVTYSATWEDSGDHWGPTLVFRVPLTKYALGVGVWLDAPPDPSAQRAEDAAYDAYVAVNGTVSRTVWSKARAEIAAMGLDPDEEMEMMQAKGVFS